MNNKPELMNNISEFFNDKSKWERNSLNILVQNKNNFKSENFENLLFNSDFLNFRIVDTTYAGKFVETIRQNEEERNFVTYSYNPTSNSYLTSYDALNSYVNIRYDDSSHVYYLDQTKWNSFSSYYGNNELDLNPLKNFDYELIKKGFSNFLKNLISKNFEFKIEENNENNYLFRDRMNSMKYKELANEVFKSGFNSLFYVYSNLLLNYMNNIVIKLKDNDDILLGLINFFESTIDSVPNNNKVIIIIENSEDVNFLVGNFKDFTYKISKNKIVKYKF